MTSYLTTQQVAKLFGMTRQAVLKWFNEGKFPNAMHIGGNRKTSIIVPEDDVRKHCTQRIAELEREVEQLQQTLKTLREFA